MKKTLVVTLLSLLVLLLAATSASAQSAEGFSVLTSDQTLWTFGDPSSLDMFLHSVVSFSLGGSPVSAAAGDNGGFVVAGSTGLATRSERGWISLGITGHRFSSVAFVPNSPNNTVVAFGVADGIVYNSAYFMRSLDGGNTWDEGVSLGQTEATGSGSIAFSGNLGVAAIGGLIFRSLDGGATWASSYSGFTTFTKVAVRDSGLIVATGPGSVGRISLKSVNAGGSWEPFQLPTFNPAAAAVTGITFLDATNWIVTTSGGEIWRTDGQVWNRTFAATNISWVDVAFLPHWTLGGVLLAAGSVPLSAKTGVFALSWDLGLTWTLSSAQPSVSFVRVVAALPQPPAPSPSPSSSPSVSPSASSSPSASPSASPTRSPSASATPSAGSSPSASPSTSPTASVTPSVSATSSPTASPSATASVSVTPTSSPSASVTPTISVTPSATPSKGSSPSPSRTPSVTPSASRTPSVTPSKGSSPSPSPSPTKKKDDGTNKKLALGLGLGLGLGGLVALIGGAALFWYLKQKGARRNVYQAINTNDV